MREKVLALPIRDPAKHNTAPNPDPSTPSGSRELSPKERLPGTEEWPQAQFSRSELCRAHSMEPHSLNLPKRGRRPHSSQCPPSPRRPSQPILLPAGACLPGGCGWPGLRTHRQTWTSGSIAPASSGPPGSRPAPAFEGGGPTTSHAPAPAPAVEQLTGRQLEAAEAREGRAGQPRRGKGAREGGTKERRGRGSDGERGELDGANGRGRRMQAGDSEPGPGE